MTGLGAMFRRWVWAAALCLLAVLLPPTAGVAGAAPSPLTGLSVAGGEGWRPTNGFTLNWSTPTSPLPITAVYYVLDEMDGSPGEATFVAGDGASPFGPIEVPAPGAYRILVGLVDSARQPGPATSAMLRFDDVPPPAVGPAPPGGWISGRELPLSLEVDRADPAGPSGIAGYAYAVSSRPGQFPCARAACAPHEIDLSGGPNDRVIVIPNLPEGRSWISTVAVSGAGLSSVEPRSVPVRVDRLAPTTRIGGVPPGWVDGPVELTVEAKDAGSGMRPQPGIDDGVPKVSIAVDGTVRAERAGSFAKLTLSAEGEHRVTHWGEDLAGNVGSPAVAGPSTVRIDLSPPRVVLSGDTAVGDPEAVRARVDDALSGVAEGSILLRPLGSSQPYASLETELKGRTLVARVPSEEIPPGRYEIAARAEDVAGNATTSTATESGAPMVVTAPMKQASGLEIGFEKARSRDGGRGEAASSRALTVGYGSAATVVGRLTTADGRPIGGAPVTVTEQFSPGAGPGRRTSRAVTDRAGRLKVALEPGPSRRITLAYAGSRRIARAVSEPIALRTRGRIGFRVRSDFVYNGEAAGMKGRVGTRGARIPARGKLVAIQYFDPGRGKWRPVEVLRTDRRGRFRYRYRFRTIGYAQRILFRAVSLEEAGWPYLRAASSKQTVLVYPRSR